MLSLELFLNEQVTSLRLITKKLKVYKIVVLEWTWSRKLKISRGWLMNPTMENSDRTGDSERSQMSLILQNYNACFYGFGHWLVNLNIVFL